MPFTVSLIIPTYNGGELFKECLSSISLQKLKLNQKIVIDSSSTDSTKKYAEEYGFQILEIKKELFDHGGTRNFALESVDSDLVIYMTQDAILFDEFSFENIVKLFLDESVDAVYGRQIPHDDANPLATFAREFSYSNKSYLTDLYDDDDDVKGFKKAFMSNSFACYRVKSLRKIGGFPSKLILGEDSYATAKFLMSGRKVGYSAGALVKHSHNYTLIEEFKRYFDTGVFHATESWMRNELGNVEGQGVKFVVEQLKFLLSDGYIVWTLKSILSSLAKITGYKLGLNYKRLPNKLCVKLSMFKGYFLR